MGKDDSPAGDSIRTMSEDLKKAQRGNQPAPQKRARGAGSLDSGQGKKRLAEIINHAEGGDGAVLRDLRSSLPNKPASPEPHQGGPTELKPTTKKLPENLDDLLPIEEKSSSDPVGESGFPKSNTELPAGSPPVNLPTSKAGLPKIQPETSTPVKPQPEADPPPAEEPKPIPDTIPTTAEGLEDDEKPKETPEELLDFSTPPAQQDEPPRELDSTPQETGLPAARRGPWKFIAALIAIVAVGSVVGFLIWNFLIAGDEEQPLITPPEQPQEILPPSPLFPANFEKTTQSVGEIRALEFSSASPESLTYVSYYLEDEERFAGPEEFFEAMNMQAPSPFFRLIGDAITPYVYTTGSEERERCTEDGFLDTSCSSSRLGIVFYVTPENLDLVGGIMKDWELTMAQDVRPMVFGEPSISTSEFSSATYRDIAIRFINLPTSTTAINYALTESFVVIATSKNSLYSVLDVIIEITSETN